MTMGQCYCQQAFASSADGYSEPSGRHQYEAAASVDEGKKLKDRVHGRYVNHSLVKCSAFIEEVNWS